MTEQGQTGPDNVVRKVDFPQAPPDAPEATIQQEMSASDAGSMHPARRFADGKIPEEQRQAMLDSKVRPFPSTDTTE